MKRLRTSILMGLGLLFVALSVQARGRPPIEVGQYIKAFMLPVGARDFVPWSIGTDIALPIRWLTDGVAERQLPRGGTVFYREAVARMQVNGKTMWMLRETKQELPWTITLSSKNRFGPESADFTPYHSNCFGGMNSGCDFNATKMMANGGLRYQKICESRHFLGNFSELYRVRAAGRKPAFVEIMNSVGSGGASTGVSLYWKLPGKTRHDWCDWLEREFDS